VEKKRRQFLTQVSKRSSVVMPSKGTMKAVLQRTIKRDHREINGKS